MREKLIETVSTEPILTGTYFVHTEVCQHDFKFSHYEHSIYQGTTALDTLAVMVCRHCGYLKKQKSNGWGIE